MEERFLWYPTKMNLVVQIWFLPFVGVFFKALAEPTKTRLSSLFFSTEKASLVIGEHLCLDQAFQQTLYNFYKVPKIPYFLIGFLYLWDYK